MVLSFYLFPAFVAAADLSKYVSVRHGLKILNHVTVVPACQEFDEKDETSVLTLSSTKQKFSRDIFHHLIPCLHGFLVPSLKLTLNDDSHSVTYKSKSRNLDAS